MIRNLILVVAITCLLVALWAIKDEKLSKKTKAIITAILAVMSVIAYIYEQNISENESKSIAILNKFKQGKTIVCGEYNVTNDKFNYEFGTATFVVKRDIKELDGVIIPIKKCEK
ncbi:hypothetical protein KDD93_00930 [Campylobacter sp. faydin G-24]|uniref:Uncharacterized protein n=1 Tax=Campylobacter anatolicus TaxID=2829105 RepID=A0ABS5HGA0_9BACT|nr:hypothetical protein [Campylobacter anatolicus]MBR8463138.1 hypothetical protein [Campylobacter anatolicus]MBR8465542.1 hypothetical protein [Campylobacter anatolicus]